MLADDEPVILSTITRALANAGYIVTAVEDGQKAWEALERESFDLLVTDQQMPNLTGLELAKMMRQHGRQIPIVVMSAVLESFSAQDSESLRITRFLRKPFSLHDMTEAVAQALQTT